LNRKCAHAGCWGLTIGLSRTPCRITPPTAA
jgi:hypothetical protein